MESGDRRPIRRSEPAGDHRETALASQGLQSWRAARPDGASEDRPVLPLRRPNRARLARDSRRQPQSVRPPPRRPQPGRHRIAPAPSHGLAIASSSSGSRRPEQHQGAPEVRRPWDFGDRYRSAACRQSDLPGATPPCVPEADRRRRQMPAPECATHARACQSHGPIDAKSAHAGSQTRYRRIDRKERSSNHGSALVPAWPHRRPRPVASSNQDWTPRA